MLAVLKVLCSKAELAFARVNERFCWAAAAVSTALPEGAKEVAAGVQAVAPATDNAMPPYAPPLPISQATGYTDASFTWGGYFGALAVMFFFLALLWFVLRFLKRSGSLRYFGSAPDLQVEGRFVLGPKKNLVVVRYHDKRLLLGVTDQQITTLLAEDLDAEELENSLNEFEGSAPNQSGIGAPFGKLMASMGIGKKTA